MACEELEKKLSPLSFWNSGFSNAASASEMSFFMADMSSSVKGNIRFVYTF